MQDISEIIYQMFMPKASKELVTLFTKYQINDCHDLYTLCLFYAENACEIDKAIQYYPLVANQDYPQAQFNFSLTYYIHRTPVDLQNGSSHSMGVLETGGLSAQFAHKILLHEKNSS